MMDLTDQPNFVKTYFRSKNFWGKKCLDPAELLTKCCSLQAQSKYR